MQQQVTAAEQLYADAQAQLERAGADAVKCDATIAGLQADVAACNANIERLNAAHADAMAKLAAEAKDMVRIVLVFGVPACVFTSCFFACRCRHRFVSPKTLMLSLRSCEIRFANCSLLVFVSVPVTG